MAEASSSIDSYLERLAEGLEAIGPVETKEVIAEIRSHLADALVDAGGDEKAVLAHFGSPDALAARMLEERGALSTGSSVPEAPESVRLLALVADIALWLVACLFVYSLVALPVASSDYSGFPSLLTVILAWVVVAVAAMTSVWWWAKKRRRAGYATTGMRLFGLRRIRMGQTTRVVRGRDIPGLARGRRFMPAVVTVLAVIIIAGFAYSIARFDRTQVQSHVENAVNNAGVGVAIVSDVYRQIMAGASIEGISGTYAATARGAMVELVQRHTAGKVDTYSIARVELPGSEPPGRSFSRPMDQIVVLVSVNEFARGSEIPSVYRYRVDCLFKPVGDGASEGRWLIQSAERVE